jgi:hypothetical protein
MPDYYFLARSQTQKKTHRVRTASIIVLILAMIAGVVIYVLRSPQVTTVKTVHSDKAPINIGPPYTTITQTQAIPYGTTTVSTPSLPTGTSKVTTPGVPGIYTLTYHVKIVNGKQVSKQLVDVITTKQATGEVRAIGTGPAQ